MPADRITQLTIEGMRCIESIKLNVKDFTVLIGENGTGKSTIIEALELLRKVATESPLIAKLYERHDGTRLIRHSSAELNLIAKIEGDGPNLIYAITVRRDGPFLNISNELVLTLAGAEPSRKVIGRTGADYILFKDDGNTVEKGDTIGNDETVLIHARFLMRPELMRVHRALAAIEVHTPLDLRRTWTNTQALQTARSSNVVRPVERIEPGGGNLVNVYAALRNQRNWRETLGRLRVSLGDIEDVLLVSEPSGGVQTIWIRWSNGSEIPLTGLSDGQISMLALVAIQQLQRRTPPTIIAIDEPEVHLHPGLIARVTVGLQEMSEETPILVGTQSDAFLNALEKPGNAVVLCKLDEQRRTELIRPDHEQLQAWLHEFKGLGAMRSEGLQDVVFPASQ